MLDAWVYQWRTVGGIQDLYFELGDDLFHQLQLQDPLVCSNELNILCVFITAVI